MNKDSAVSEAIVLSKVVGVAWVYQTGDGIFQASAQSGPGIPFPCVCAARQGELLNDADMLREANNLMLRHVNGTPVNIHSWAATLGNALSRFTD